MSQVACSSIDLMVAEHSSMVTWPVRWGRSSGSSRPYSMLTLALALALSPNPHPNPDTLPLTLILTVSLSLSLSLTLDLNPDPSPAPHTLSLTLIQATEIQNIQIADGAVCHGWAIPVHAVIAGTLSSPEPRPEPEPEPEPEP